MDRNQVVFAHRNNFMIRNDLIQNLRDINQRYRTRSSERLLPPNADIWGPRHERRAIFVYKYMDVLSMLRLLEDGQPINPGHLRELRRRLAELDQLEQEIFEDVMQVINNHNQQGNANPNH